MTDIILTSIILFLIVLTCWRDWHYSRLVDQLTNKLMAKDWSDYSVHNFATNKFDKSQPKPKQDAKKPVSDPVLGIHC